MGTLVTTLDNGRLALLTLGIVLGSWWAYYELGWGGWWFWDQWKTPLSCLGLPEQR